MNNVNGKFVKRFASLPRVESLKCKFCLAFYPSAVAAREHIENCEFRLSEMFLSFDGRMKFACTVRVSVSVILAGK